MCVRMSTQMLVFELGYLWEAVFRLLIIFGQVECVHMFCTNAAVTTYGCVRTSVPQSS